MADDPTPPVKTPDPATVRIKIDGPDAATPPAPKGDGDDKQQKMISDLRAEAAAHRVGERKAREEAETAKAALAAAQADIDGKLKAENEKATARITKMQQRVIESDLKAQAVAAGLEDMDLLPLLDRSGIKMDDDGNVTGVKEAIEAFKAKKPDYFKKASGGGEPKPKPKVTGDGGAPKPGDTPPDNVKQMKPEEYRAWKANSLRKMRGLPSRA